MSGGGVVCVGDAVGGDEAAEVGISRGGMIAQLVALDHSERVRKLVLMSTHMGGPNIEQMHPDAQSLFDPSLFLRGDAEATMRRTLGVITAPGWVEANPAPLQELLDHAKREPTPATVFMAQLHARVNGDLSVRRL